MAKFVQIGPKWSQMIPNGPKLTCCGVLGYFRVKMVLMVRMVLSDTFGCHQCRWSFTSICGSPPSWMGLFNAHHFGHTDRKSCKIANIFPCVEQTNWVNVSPTDFFLFVLFFIRQNKHALVSGLNLPPVQTWGADTRCLDLPVVTSGKQRWRWWLVPSCP